jgi:hypothetical protein
MRPTVSAAKLQHDCATAMATALMEIIGPCLRGEEQHDAFLEFYRVTKLGLESFVIQRNRDLTRQNPSLN